jgi:hypothetical protein
LPSFLGELYVPKKGKKVVLNSYIPQDEIKFRLMKMKLSLMNWRAQMSKFAGSSQIPTEVTDHAMAVSMKAHIPLIEWMMGEDNCGVGNTWEVPMLDWKHAMHCIIEGMYSSSQRSDWRESKIKQVWREIAEFSEFSLMGFPWQEVWEVDEQGQHLEQVDVMLSLEF